MDESRLAFLKELVEAHGTSGYEQGIQQIFRRQVEPLVDEIRTDRLGSLLAVRNPAGSPRILIDAHPDEIGFVVKHIDERGFLFVERVGGWDIEVLVAQRVLVQTAQGALPGVFGKKAIHLMDDDERKKKSELHKVWVDIGAKDGVEARQLVSIGDPVTLEASFVQARNGLAIAKTFDDRAGLFVMAETLRLLHGQDFPASVFAVSAVQEEIGVRGAQVAAYGVDPVIGIAIDVSHTSDYPEVDKRKVGEIALGQGPILVRGPNIHPQVFQRLVEVAREREIPYQVQTSGAPTGTDARAIQMVRAGVATGLIGIPLRYMHSPGEMLALSDLEDAAALLAAFILSCQEHRQEHCQAQDNWNLGS